MRLVSVFGWGDLQCANLLLQLRPQQSELRRFRLLLRRMLAMAAVGAGLLGFGVGAIIGSALTPQTVYVAPPPPPVYYVPPPPPVITGLWFMDLHTYGHYRYESVQPDHASRSQHHEWISGNDT
jgi:hypothetical protein